MPTYYFDVVEINGAFKEDKIGIILVDAEAAKVVAIKTFADMAQEAVYDDLSQLRVEVRDSEGHVLLRKIAYFEDD